MKILQSKQIQNIDAFTIANEPIDSADLMERASQLWTDVFIEKNPITLKSKSKIGATIKIFCGLGNNGGDGLCIARLLHYRGYKVEVFICRYTKNASPDFLLNEKRLKRISEITVKDIKKPKDFPSIHSNEILIEALFGSGLSRPLSGLTAQLIEYLNNTNATRIAVDMPSGLMDAQSLDSPVFRASQTYTFQFAKLSQLLPQNFPFVGDLTIVPIGLHPKAIAAAETNHFLLDKNEINTLIKKREKFGHKGTYGHSLIIGGSEGKSGAALLCAKACLKSGSGLVTAYTPANCYSIFQTAFPECMLIVDDYEKYICDVPITQNIKQKYRAIGIGPGLGQHPQTAKALQKLLVECKKIEMPLVIDADALNIIAQNKWHNLIPPKSILTPHPKEFERLTQKPKDNYEQLELLQNLAKEIQCIVLLKRAHTVIALPDGQLFFNTTGNPAMGTAGSGDALTGVITGLMAQGYESEEAAKLGVYFHGKAGDDAIKQQDKNKLFASDLIECFCIN